MSDASYDAVVVGGGHNGLVVACYLAYNGLSVAVFESEHEIGGGACSDEVPLPGFVSNLCAQSTRFYNHPAYSDFMLAEKGLDAIFPEVGNGAIFDDGACVVTYPLFPVADKMTGRTEFSQTNLEKTLRAIARLSEKDAETAGYLFEKFRTKWLPAMREALYSPPKPWGEKDAAEKLMDDPDSGFDPIWATMSVAQLAYDLWESLEMQAYTMRRMWVIGAWPDAALGPSNALEAIVVAFTLYASFIPLGGTHGVVHALQKALTDMGGKFFVHHEVDKVLIENGTAKGVRLVDGTEIEARKIVVSNLDMDQSINRLIGPEHVSPKIVKRVKNIDYDDATASYVHVALREPPRYKSEDNDPDSGWLVTKVLMQKDPDYTATKYKAQVFTRGLAEKLIGCIWNDSRFARNRVPEGKHESVWEEYVCPLRFLSDKEWLQMKTRLADEVMKQWQWYAPNMTWDNVIAFYTHTVYDNALRNKAFAHAKGNPGQGSMVAWQLGRFRPIPELASYRAPIKNMYLSSCALHPGIGVRGGPGYNCYKVITEDFGLRKVWDEKGRAY